MLISFLYGYLTIALVMGLIASGLRNNPKFHMDNWDMLGFCFVIAAVWPVIVLGIAMLFIPDWWENFRARWFPGPNDKIPSMREIIDIVDETPKRGKNSDV